MSARLRLGLVCSAGGHLDQLYALRAWWSQHDRFWVCHDLPDARARLAGERVYWAFHPTQRSPLALARNAALAARVLCAERPDAVVSNGAGVGVPFLWVGRATGAICVFVEVADRVDHASLSGRLVRPVVHAVGLPVAAQLGVYPEGVVLEAP